MQSGKWNKNFKPYRPILEIFQKTNLFCIIIKNRYPTIWNNENTMKITTGKYFYFSYISKINFKFEQISNHPLYKRMVRAKKIKIKKIIFF